MPDVELAAAHLPFPGPGLVRFGALAGDAVEVLLLGRLFVLFRHGFLLRDVGHHLQTEYFALNRERS